MPADRDPRDNRDQPDAELSEHEGISLTDLFDQMDREAFKRSLEHRSAAKLKLSNPRPR